MLAAVGMGIFLVTINGTIVNVALPTIVTEAFPDSERGKALGTAGTLVSIGIVLGPTLGEERRSKE